MSLKGDNWKNNRGQLTIFIIIAIVIVGMIVVFFVFRDSLIFTQIPAEIVPVYTTFLSCLEEDTLVGINFLGSQAGYIEIPEFEPGSSYMPFSSQLDFLGNPIPYWYYVSGNNIPKEQVPSKRDMEEQLGDFIEEKINNCRFDEYYEQGFEITFEEAEVEVIIEDNVVKLNIDMDLSIVKDEESVLIGEHKISVNSKLGTLYDSAKRIYDIEQETLFLENYGIDTLRLYAPVDGVDLKCSPSVWNANDILEDLQQAIQDNTLTLKAGTKVFADGEDKYFIKDLSVSEDVRFLNSKNWPYAFEVTPAEGNLLISQPIGNQQGLGILGFCYVPYHFVYDIKYPVLVQIFSGDEIFQFPLAVIIQGNNPREALETNAVEIGVVELCNQKNTEIQVNVYDTNFNPVDADISYECFGTSCSIGETSFGSLKENFPQCVNGRILARADGFKDSKHQFSTVESGSVDVILERVYEINVDLKLDGRDYNKNAMISFISEGGSETIIYPGQRTVKLSEGEYEIQTYVYRNSSINLPSSTTEQCIDIPQSGLGGFLGFTKEKCFNIDFPSQIISNSLSGGGKQNYFILESQLINSNTIEINADSLPIPNSIEQLQTNYILFDEKNLIISFR